MFLSLLLSHCSFFIFLGFGPFVVVGGGGGGVVVVVVSPSLSSEDM